MHCIRHGILASLIGLATVALTANSLTAQVFGVGGNTEAASPAGTPGAGSAQGRYDAAARMLLLFVEAREGFAAVSAEVRTVSDFANPVVTLTENVSGSRQFDGSVILAPLEDNALFNDTLLFTLTDASGAMVRGRLGLEQARDRQGMGTLPNGDTIEVDTMQFSPGDEMAVAVRSSGTGFLGADVLLGTPSQPGNLLGTVGPSISGEARSSFVLTPNDSEALLSGGASMFLSIDMGQGMDLDIPVSAGAGDTLSFPNGQEAGTTSTGFGRLFFEEEHDGGLAYSGDLFCTVATSVELRQGQFGQVGTLVTTLNQDATGMRFDGALSLTPAQRVAYQNGELFVLVRTAAFPAGELRGQVLFAPWLPATFGLGCADANGEHNLLTSTDTAVCVARDATFMVTNADPGAMVVFMLGFQSEMLPTIDLASSGLPDCRLLFLPSHFLGAPANANGTATLTLNVPSHFVQLSIPFFVVQAAVVSPGANPLGVITTNGLRVLLN